MMTVRRPVPALAVALLLALARAAAAQEEAVELVHGDRRVALTADRLAGLPRMTVQTGDHGRATTIEGIPLAAVLGLVGVEVGDRLRGPALARYVLVTGRDGYRVVVALADTDPAMRQQPVLFADRQDGRPWLPDSGPWRIVVPGDARGARWVRQVARIEVKEAP
jgi:hypothetical protein